MEFVPLLEFDNDRMALIEPSIHHKNINPPERCVMPFYASVIIKLKNDKTLEKIYELEPAGVLLSPIDVYKINSGSDDVSVVFPGLGAPLTAALFEELIALGCRKFVACGSCGVLKPELKRGVVVIPNSAVRDEGTSFHYCPPGRTIEMEPEVTRKMEAVLQRHNVPYEVGKTWTTDGFYRETRGKITKRKAEGCITVEMECAALLAVAKFRGVVFGQYLGAGDDVSGDVWDPRRVEDRLTFQEKLFWLSVEAVLNL
ncbi:MAG TPA: nucleoside phosphorylase [Dehalococcoidales bacterium]